MTSKLVWFKSLSTDLKSLKPGDKVYYTHGMKMGIKIIERVTPTGRVVLKNHNGQFINGIHKLGHSNYEHVGKLTDERKADFYNRIENRKIVKCDVSVDTTDAVYEVVH